MSRKIFISILGTGYYQKTKYLFSNPENNSSKETNFVQETLLLQLAKKWTKTDACFIFLTNDARKINWETPAQKDNSFVKKGQSETYTGLKQVIENGNFKFKIEDVNIPNGNNEDEIWQIFENVFSVIEENDEVYFDVTHAFRSIPMLVMVLINYAKLLKNINVKSISYGNWEGRNKEGNMAPIIDLTSFSQLQDWTNATNLFVNHGNLGALSDLTRNEINPILRETRGQDETANELRNLSNLISDISLSFKVNNIPQINSGTLFGELNESIENIENNLIPPLNPILKKINNKFNEFSVSEDVRNGIKAVNFCINNGLIQQAYTILQESIITIVLNDISYDVKTVKNRNIVSGVFKIHKENYPYERWGQLNKENKDLTERLLTEDIIADLVSVFNAITEKRNIINHAGFNDKASDKVFRNLEADIIGYYTRVKERLAIKD